MLFSPTESNALPLNNINRTHLLPASAFTVGILFTASLVLANLAAFKLVAIGNSVFAAGLVFFPLTYLFDDILTEVYGFQISRRIIWLALMANFIIFIGIYLTTFLPSAPGWPHQAAYATLYQAAPRIFIASTFSYLVGEFANSIVLAKLKIYTRGKYLWFRIVMSTIAGVGLDTILFTHIAFLFTVPYAMLWQVIATMCMCKVLYEIAALPITYKITGYLKQKDQVDHYDYGTNFNPFSWKMN